MWKSCDTWGTLVFLQALWHSWLLRCVHSHSKSA